MTTKTLCLVGLLLYLSSDLGCVCGQPNTDQRNRDTNGSCKEGLLEQTFHTLQSIAGRLESLEKRQSSMEQWMKENDKDTRCKWSVDGSRTCYKLVLQKMTWSDGRVYCQSLGEGADLVSIETQQENEFLIAMIREVNQLRRCVGTWTSGKKDPSGVWTWMATGQPFGYTYWMRGQPDNSGGIEDTCNFWDRDRDIVGIYWNDESHLSKGCLLCEIP
ncbi:hypothetical protein LSAT2_008471 [Lamellibrachia satsuma]|nr:hypothetical protein LSAT2_008471 [Lamellibrachia satsuma]